MAFSEHLGVPHLILWFILCFSCEVAFFFVYSISRDFQIIQNALKGLSRAPWALAAQVVQVAQRHGALWALEASQKFQGEPTSFFCGRGSPAHCSNGQHQEMGKSPWNRSTRIRISDQQGFSMRCFTGILMGYFTDFYWDKSRGFHFWQAAPQLITRCTSR